MDTNKETENEEKIPEVVKNEPDDNPAGKGIIWVIVIALIIAAIIYFVFFNEPKEM